MPPGNVAVNGEVLQQGSRIITARLPWLSWLRVIWFHGFFCHRLGNLPMRIGARHHHCAWDHFFRSIYAGY